MNTRGGVTIVTGLVGALALGVVEGRAQTPDPTGSTCPGGGSAGACGSGWIFEVQGSTVVASNSVELVDAGRRSRFEVADASAVVEWNFGRMWALNPEWSVGSTFSLGTHSREKLTGVRLRLRRRLSAALSLDVEAGAALYDGDGWWGDTQVGRSAGVRLSGEDYWSVFVRQDRFGHPQRWNGPPWGGQLEGDPVADSRAFYRIGIGFGRSPAVWGSLVVLAGLLKEALGEG